MCLESHSPDPHCVRFESAQTSKEIREWRNLCEILRRTTRLLVCLASSNLRKCDDTKGFAHARMPKAGHGLKESEKAAGDDWSPTDLPLLVLTLCWCFCPTLTTLAVFSLVLDFCVTRESCVFQCRVRCVLCAPDVSRKSELEPASCA